MSFNGLPEQDVEGTVANDGWWPDLELGDFQKRYRLPVEFSREMVEESIQLGMLRVNDQLREWREEQLGSSLAEVPGEQMGDLPRYQILYSRAVFCHAKALLLKQFATVNRRDAAKHEGMESEESEEKFLEFARDAVADFLNLPRIGVHEL